MTVTVGAQENLRVTCESLASSWKPAMRETLNDSGETHVQVKRTGTTCGLRRYRSRGQGRRVQDTGTNQEDHPFKGRSRTNNYKCKGPPYTRPHPIKIKRI